MDCAGPNRLRFSLPLLVLTLIKAAASTTGSVSNFAGDRQK